MKRKAIVIGATGLVGEKLVAQLSFIYDTLIVIARQPPKHMSEQMEFYQLKDFNNIDKTIESMSLNSDTDAFTCLGTTKKQAGSKEAFWEIDYEFNLKFATACYSKGVEQFFLLSALGADAKSRFFYNQVKGDLESAISDIGFKQLMIFQPSLLLGSHKGRPLETITQQAFKMVLPILPKTFAARPISARRVAAAISMTAQDLYERSRFKDNRFRDKALVEESKPNVTIINNKRMLKMTSFKA